MRMVLVVVLSFGCKSEDQQVNEYLVTSATKSVAELKQILASNTPKRPIDWGMVTGCAGNMANIDTLAKANQPLADELRRLCTKDVPLAAMKFETEQAEAAVKAKPNAELYAECHSPTFAFAKDQMTEAKTIDLAKDVMARFQAACPR
ncbi:MAG: hypothetical protein M4D80_18810 [Myxococcota bacterium]|nr:hypothetical protein [Myxococcota bacterium]